MSTQQKLTEIQISGKTAIHRNKASLPIRHILAFESPHDVKGYVLYHGRGKDFEGMRLLKECKRVGLTIAYDPNQPDICDRSAMDLHLYDTIFSIFVLNVLPPKYRSEVLMDIYNHLRDDDSVAFIAVRNDKDGGFKRCDKWTKIYDGYRTSAGTFQKFYTNKQLTKELSKYFKDIKILANESSFTLARVQGKI